MYISPLRRFRLPLAISSWLTFAISLTLYWITADPGVSYWDCPEYVTVASKMEVGHPPGNPIWMLVMRVATIPFSPENHAYVINLFSGAFMAFGAFFLCRLIFLPTRIYFQRLHHKVNLSQQAADIVSSFIAIGSSLCFALCDSSWFSAVEAEVYAMSTFLTALSLWIMIVWAYEKSKSRRTRLLVLIAYLTGLSLGVHQLNLLLIPVFALIIFYRRCPGRINPLWVWIWFIVACIILGIILLGFMPGTLFGAESFELLAANTLSLPYNYGLLIFGIFLLVVIVVTIILSPSVGVGLGAFLFAYSSFFMIMIRAQAAPPMNEANPDNIFSLSSYINREQYPSSPLIYGETPYSRPMFEETFINGKPLYSKYLLKKEKPIYQPVMPEAALNYRSGMLSNRDSIKNLKALESQQGYLLSDYKFSQILTPELNMWFPRMTSRNASQRLAYADWGGMTEENMLRIPISETLDSNGNPRPRIDMWGERTPVYSYRPTYLQNLRYFIAYQSYYMYFRYLFWNFIGRQNDFPSNGEIEHGNFITGIPAIDNVLVGDTDSYPPEIWEKNKGHNQYFGIPFLLGILGIIWLACGNHQSRRLLTLISVFFLMTGIAIVVYLNQMPGEPRERDYTFIGSYMAFAMWIAAGLTLIVRMALYLNSKKLALIIGFIVSISPATLMALENFDDHDRRNRYEPTFFASSLLDFEFPSIIFSHGDNSTFPLWYASEVLGMGKRHTPIDITYLSLPSYVVNLKKQGAKGVTTIASTPEIAYGKFVITKLPEASSSSPIPLADALKKLYKSEAPTPEWPSVLVTIETSHGSSHVINLRDFTKGSSYLPFKTLMLLDLLSQLPLNNTTSYMLFPSLIDHSFYQPLDSLLQPALFGKIYAPDLSRDDAMEILQNSVIRELQKLENLNIKPHYADPVIADRTVRYRGELIIAANDLLNYGDTVLPIKIADAIEKHYPYKTLLPGTFTVCDSTYYEGKEFIKLLDTLYGATGDARFRISSQKLDSLMAQRHEQWLRFYQSLSPSQRQTLSSRSRRLLLP